MDDQIKQSISKLDNKYLNMTLLVHKLLRIPKDRSEEEQGNCKVRLRINLTQNFLIFPDLFVDDTICLTTNLELSKYIYTTCRNWDNYEPKNKIIAVNKKNDKETKKNGGTFGQFIYTLWYV